MTAALDIVSWIFLIAGSAFAVIGGIGIVRLPDFFSRMHGGGITDTMGATLILIGLMFQAPSAGVAIKLVMILGFLLISSPTSGHALAKAALTNGLEPQLDSIQESGGQGSGGIRRRGASSTK